MAERSSADVGGAGEWDTARAPDGRRGEGAPAAPGAAASLGAVEAVWRIESGRLIAGLARVTGDLGLAEELAQDALVVALEQWPVTGIPPNPAGWLMTTAKNRAIDQYRRRAVHERTLQTIGRDVEDGHDPISAELDERLDDHIC